MEIRQILILRHKPEVRGASWQDRPFIEMALPEVINFSRAVHGEAHMLVSEINDQEDLKEAKTLVSTIVKVLALNEDELTVNFTEFKAGTCGDDFCLKVVVTAK